ncbi:MAG TPA: arginine--tRNA ligase [Acidimicrobiales bacterium]|nr:arginine--tRNA ligase [Acidimicrobiales bacterium]
MASVASLLAPRFDAALTAAFGADLAGTDPLLRPSQHADVQSNAAMGLAKRLGRNPREVAQAIVEHLAVDDLCRDVAVAGPGFVNLTLRPEVLAALVTQLDGPRLGVAPATRSHTVVVDYSGPNVAKEMHVGHLRSTIIGDAVVRVLEFLGHEVIRQNHLGDWGTNFGMLIEHLVDLGEEKAAAELSLGDLARFYQEAREKFEEDPGFADRARARVVRFQSGEAESLRLWRLLIEESGRYFDEVYRRLDVTLTPADMAGESFYNDMLADVAAELEAAGLAVVDDGALCVYPPGFTGRDGAPFPVIVRKRDGGFNYEATDLAAIRHRARTLGATWLLYVIGAPQGQRLSMLFAVARMAGWLGDEHRAEHVAFGSVLGADGKMFRTRAGESVRLVDLLDEAVRRAAAVVAEKNPSLGEAARAEVAEAVGIGAVKYADLSSDRVKDYVFDFDRMLSFEGNTAPYLQYAHARIRSIFRRAEVNPFGLDPALLQVVHPAERALALQLTGFEPAVTTSAAHLQPHRLCTYLFDVASAFTSFYEACPVIKADSTETRLSRLVLCDRTARVLRTGLGLLGIAAPEQL